MSADSLCEGLARRLAAVPDEDLARFAREEATHFEGCRSCRAELALRDPSALFALLAFEKKDDAFFAGFETRVMAGVREAQREARGGWLGAILRPRTLALAAGIAAIAIALVLRGEAPSPQIAQRVRVTPPIVVPPGPLQASDGLPILERDAAEPSPVESVASSTARVISIKVAGAQQEPSDIVLIVDPEMPL